MEMNWGDHITSVFLEYPVYMLSWHNVESTSFHFQNCLHLSGRLYGYCKTIFQRNFLKIIVIMPAIFLNPNFSLLLYSQRLMEYKYFWTKTLALLTFTKSELNSIKNEVYDHFKNWTSLKREVFLQIKSISETALSGLLNIFKI